MGTKNRRWWENKAQVLRYTWIVLLCILELTASCAGYSMKAEDFHFTHSLYNATIPEMALSKSYVTSTKKMGIYVSDPKINVRYKIEDGDKTNVFKVEDFRVGDFVFLRVRTHSSTYGSLNRELESKFHLKIKAIGQYDLGFSLSATTELIIKVLDKNDLNPLFDPEHYNVSVSEDTPLHSSLLKVSASDGDVGVNSEIYYSFVQKTYTFAIHPSSGVITLTRQLNFYEQNKFILMVTAQDRGPRSPSHNRLLRRNANVTIYVTQANFFKPEITVQHLPSIIENSHAGIVYAVLNVIDEDSGDNGRIANVRITQDMSNAFQTFHTKDKERYELVLVKTLDPERVKQDFDVIVEATDHGSPPKSTTSTVRVNIIDLNINRDIFKQTSYSVSIKEDAPKGSSVVYLQPNNEDQAQTLDIIYSILNKDQKLFEIGKYSGLIKTAAPLDAESVDFVRLHINAIDRGYGGRVRRGAAEVNITIMDCNDNDPAFNISETNIAFDENLAVGSVIFKVKATDADQGENGHVSYSIANVDEVPFEIDHFSGAIKVTKLLDFETMLRTYKVIIRASDGGSPYRRESEILMNFHLSNVNDNKPVFEKVNCSGYLSREADVGTDIVIITAIDFDYNILTYTISSGNDDGCFELESATGRLMLNCSLASAEVNERKVVIIASDGKYESDPVSVDLTLVNNKRTVQLSNKDANVHCKTTNASLELAKVLQISRQNNDVKSKEMQTSPLSVENVHTPAFNSSLPEVIPVSENAPVGSSVLHIDAYDEDIGFNGLLVYSILDGDPYDNFRVNSTTGDLVVISPLDREFRPKYELKIMVCDSATEKVRKTATTMLTVRVEDENDNRPKFEHDFYKTSMSEGILVNATVIQVIAEDKDIGNNGKVVYTLATDIDKFTIDSQNGIITVSKPLDREIQDEYTFIIRATDKGDNPLSSTATVNVVLQDENDNVPRFVPESYDVKLREDLPIGSVVTSVKAEDPDIGKNGKLTYQLFYGAEGTFEIDELTGIIRITKELDYEKKQVYNISAHVSDGGSPPLMSACFINIEVIDVNDNVEPPVFDSFYEVGLIKENLTVGSIVMIISARDPDAKVLENGDRNTVTYSITDGTGLGYFTIDNDGTIRTSQVLDRETTSHYWLTVYATDKGLVPLHTRLEVYIKVIDVNDNVPQMRQPVYNMEVPENSRSGEVVGQVQAYDNDENPSQELTFAITGGDSMSYFDIDKITGVIVTTSKRLDREGGQPERFIEVTVYDNGSPNLSSTAQVVVRILDENDNKPQFLESYFRVRVMSIGSDVKEAPLLRVIAKDEDEGQNAKVSYKLKGRKNQFRIDQTTGMIYGKGPLDVGTFDLKVRAFDNGTTRKKDVTLVRIEVSERLITSPNPPSFPDQNVMLDVFENCDIGQIVGLVQAEDLDNDKMWYTITDGDPNNRFTINPEFGSILVAEPLDREIKRAYNLTVSVTDGVHTDNVKVHISVLDINDNTPMFTSAKYETDVAESAQVGTSILHVSAIDKDENSRLFYKFTSAENAISLQKFGIDTESGVIRVKEVLDREVMHKHKLTVMVRDQGVRTNRNFTCVIINVLDQNDHAPKFLSNTIQGRVFETAAVGTSVVQLTAVDRDKGINAELTYSIVSGNIDMAFAMEETFGIISVARELDKNVKSDYKLIVMAKDKGNPALSSTATVRISVTISNNAPPKFPQEKYIISLTENAILGSHVTSVLCESQSSVVYDIVSGNDKHIFAINPNSGVVYVKRSVDFEEQNLHNLTVSATNIIGKSDTTNVVIHVLDINDNAPVFRQTRYQGNISETAVPGSLVLGPDIKPLVIQATDKDMNENAQLTFTMLDGSPDSHFSIDPNTGAIKTLAALDHEKFDKMEFFVQVTDSGDPPLSASNPTKVVVYIDDVNDNAPVFTFPEFHARVLLPTAADVEVLTLQAIDPDTKNDENLRYRFVDGDPSGRFRIDENSGKIHVQNETNILDTNKLKVMVTDGKFETSSDVHITVVNSSNSGFTFRQKEFNLPIKENFNESQWLTVIQVTNVLNEHLVFTLLNGNDMFSIVRTSGVLLTKGRQFDRELKAHYRLIIKVEDLNQPSRIAHVLVNINIEDENDNAPMFVNQPYDTVVAVNCEIGTVVRQVTAIDQDAGANSQVIYSLDQNYMDKFVLDSNSGQIRLDQPLTTDDENKAVELIVQAQDKGTPSQTSKVKVSLRIVSDSHPVFEQQFYEVSVKEDMQPDTPITTIKAISPNGHKLIYSITSGDPYKEFSVDFNIGMDVLGPCVVTIVSLLDYESTQNYTLTLRAADVKTGAYTDTTLRINVLDVNDKKPSFSHYKYTAVLSEAVAMGTFVIKVTATDRDTGLNAEIQYDLAPLDINFEDVRLFEIDPISGDITTKEMLDHERKGDHSFLVMATDGGFPAQTMTVPVQVIVDDLNDNPPSFDKPSYDCFITDQQSSSIVTKVSASDPDTCSQGSLEYTITDGNIDHIFDIDATSGLITLSTRRKNDLYHAYLLNVSVCDGVFVNFAQVSVTIKNSNKYSPGFEKSQYRAKILENIGTGMLITTVTAVDKDRGNYGMLTYTIPSKEMGEYFSIDADTGEIFAAKLFDREEQDVYSITVAASDNGGRMGFTNVIIEIDDVNDNIPQFLRTEYKACVRYDAEMDSSVIQIQAEDRDLDEAAHVTYELHDIDMLGVGQKFYIDPMNGVIHVKQNLTFLRNEVFQFFVQASDLGNPQLMSNVPVEIYISGTDQYPPRVKPRHSFVIPENELVGTIVGTVKALSKDPVDYKIVSGYSPEHNTPETFTIDSSGEIKLMERWKEEKLPQYSFTVRVVQKNSPHVVAHTEVDIAVANLKLTTHKFEASTYVLTVPENSVSNTRIVQCRVLDKGRSVPQVQYKFDDATVKQYEHLFSINTYSGWVTLISHLDRETKAEYNLLVLAESTGSNRKVLDSTVVKVQVTDDNDNPPVFSQSNYFAAVNEDAFRGTVLLTLSTKDADTAANAEVDYYIVQGDPMGKFQVHKTGDLFVAKPLDRESKVQYQLLVAATDGGMASMAAVTVDILDANDNAPVCDQPIHQIVLSEDVSLSSIVTQVKATDADDRSTPNGRIQYTLVGEELKSVFDVNKDKGIVSTKKLLDREEVAHYHLIVSAADGGGRSCETDIYIELSDINDNPPKFVDIPEKCSISESADPDTLLIRVTALDPDLGINRQVKYQLIDTLEDTFDIDPDSGIVKLLKKVDREIKANYSLEILAYDQGTPSLSSSTALSIVLLDVNDNPPEFTRSSYLASVPENASAGTMVTTVTATSKDIGDNAKMIYTIMSGNNMGKFVIDANTGDIRVANHLDREVIAEYILTLLAKDRSPSPLSSSAYITINITDVNDNPPRFSQATYRASVIESEKVGHVVAKLTASDIDSPANAMLTYKLMEGDSMDNFNLDPKLGKLTIKNPLDREMIPRHKLTVRVTDSGDPQLHTETFVNIEVRDANDCPPRFSEDNYTTTVQEDKYVGYKVLEFRVTDDDLRPNGEPFTFDIISGNDGGEFRIDHSGILSTAGKFNRNIKDSYLLEIRVLDNGTPALYSDVPVSITIIEEGMTPPVVQNLDISISSYHDEFPGGVIGTLVATDEDVFDQLHYQVVSPNTHLFDIDKTDGRIIAFKGLDAGNYVINVSVTDGRNIVYGKANVDVLAISQTMIDSSVTVQLQSLTPEEFILNYKKKFQRAMKQILNVRMKDVEIINVQSSRLSLGLNSPRSKRSTDLDDLDVLLAVKKSTGNVYFRRKKLQKRISQNMDKLENFINAKVIKVIDDICPQDSCQDGRCVGYVGFDNSLTPVSVGDTSFVMIRHYNTYKCICLNGIEADTCDTHSLCAKMNCPFFKTCEYDAFKGPQCVCPEGKKGEFCNQDIDELDRCTDYRCHNGEKPMTFSGQSFAKWTLRDAFTIESRLSLSVRIKTRRQMAYIMYTTGVVDYSILEVFRGMVQYKFNCGSGEGLVVIPVLVNDGEWHTIKVERNQRRAQITLDNKFTGIDDAPGGNDVLNLNTNDVYFGAEVIVDYNGYHNIKHGFDGCMEEIKLFNVRLPFKGSNAVVNEDHTFKEVEFHCKDTFKPVEGSSMCSNDPCMNGGLCDSSANFHYICKCPERFEGNRCELDRNPCADKPCKNNGICYNIKDSPNDFQCVCPNNLKGRYCEYGLHCSSDPCMNGGSCVEGPESYICMCHHGYSGTQCQEQLCASNPCLYGGTCITLSSSTYKCNCTNNRAGKHCEYEGLVNAAITPDSGITQGELYIIIGIAAGLIFLAFLFVIIQCARRRRSHAQGNISYGVACSDERDVMLKMVHDNKTCKTISDQDIRINNGRHNIPPSPRPPPVPNRPVSYTPSNHDSLNTLNNFDNVRNYGSAADELENCHNIPYTQEFLTSFAPPPRSNASMAPSLPPPPPSNPASDTESIQKIPWEGDYPNMLENLEEKKHPEKFPRSPNRPGFFGDTTSFSSLPVSESEDEPDYHWDASDWAPRPSLPNISEVPMKEIPDSPSSSPHSNESNTHIGFQQDSFNNNDLGMYTDPEMLESEYVGDSEFADNEYDNDDQCYMSPPSYHQILGLPQTPEENEVENYELPEHNLHTHPDQYLPHYSFTQSNEQMGADRGSNSDWPEPPSCDENDVYTSDNDDNDEVVTYGFPSSRQGGKGFVSDGGITDSEYNVRNSVIDRMSMSMGGYASTNASVSDISGLCEIEDSELNLSDEDNDDDEEDEDENDERTPLKSMCHLHTRV